MHIFILLETINTAVRASNHVIQTAFRSRQKEFTSSILFTSLFDLEFAENCVEHLRASGNLFARAALSARLVLRTL
jgi:hypothetical protein